MAQARTHVRLWSRRKKNGAKVLACIDGNVRIFNTSAERLEKGNLTQHLSKTEKQFGERIPAKLQDVGASNVVNNPVEINLYAVGALDGTTILKHFAISDNFQVIGKPAEGAEAPLVGFSPSGTWLIITCCPAGGAARLQAFRLPPQARAPAPVFRESYPDDEAFERGKKKADAARNRWVVEAEDSGLGKKLVKCARRRRAVSRADTRRSPAMPSPPRLLLYSLAPLPMPPSNHTAPVALLSAGPIPTTSSC